MDEKEKAAVLLRWHMAKRGGMPMACASVSGHATHMRAHQESVRLSLLHHKGQEHPRAHAYRKLHRKENTQDGSNKKKKKNLMGI